MAVRERKIKRCEAIRQDGGQCLRRAQWDGLCFQHWRIQELARRAAETIAAKMADVRRPPSVPASGQIAAFDAGWNAHGVGLERETVAALAPLSGRVWALLGYDTRVFAAAQTEEKP